MSVLLIWGEMKTFTLTYRLVLHGISIFNVENRASYLSVLIKAKLLTLQRSHLFTAADSSPQRPCIAKKTCFLMIFDRGSHWFLKLKHACVWHKNKPNCLLWVMNKLQSFHSPYVCADACTLINVYMFFIKLKARASNGGTEISQVWWNKSSFVFRKMNGSLIGLDWLEDEQMMMEISSSVEITG